MTSVIDFLTFETAVESITATNVGEVINVVDFAERHSRAGSYVVVMISYEAAPAFDSAFTVYESNGFPLAFAAVYSETSHPTETRSAVSVDSWTPAVTKH